jgi:hypothetical protein
MTARHLRQVENGRTAYHRPLHFRNGAPPSLPLPQHDPPHRPAACAFDAGDQICLSHSAAASVVAHSIEDGPDRQNALCGVRLIEQPLLATALASHPQEPRRERGERLVQGLGAGGQRAGAVAPPVASWDGPAHADGRWPHLPRSSAVASGSSAAGVLRSARCDCARFRLVVATVLTDISALSLSGGRSATCRHHPVDLSSGHYARFILGHLDNRDRAAGVGAGRRIGREEC